MKKKSRIFKIILIVFLVLILVLSVISVKFWNTITAVIDGLNYSQDEIENVRIENQKAVDKELEKYPDLYFRNLTEEEIKAVSEGKIKKEDIPYLVTGRKVYKDGAVITAEEYEKLLKEEKTNSEKEMQDTKEEKPLNTNPQEPTKSQAQLVKPQVEPDTPKTDPELEAVLEKLFVLKATFLADIETQVDNMINEYLSIPKKYRSKKVRNEYISKAFSLMAQTEPKYDAEFETVVKELETVLQEKNGDMSLVDTVRETYRKEKASIKSKYVSKAREYM